MNSSTPTLPTRFRWLTLLAIGIVIFTARVFAEHQMWEALDTDSPSYFVISQVWDVLVFWELIVWYTIAFFIACKALRFVTRRPLADLFTH